MKIFKDIEQRSPEWHELRKGKITGTLLKRVIGGAKTQDGAFYELLAERLSTAGVETASAMDRGLALEPEALSVFEKKSGKKVTQVAFVQSDFNKNIGYSPDGLIMKGKKCSEDVEVKCLSSANHVRAWLTNSVPDEYDAQIIQGFIANDDLKTRHVVFYDPRIEVHPYHCIKVERKDVAEKVESYKKAEIDFLKRVDETLAKIIKL